MPAYKPNRALPAHITIPNWDAYQVRIVRDGVEHSKSFSLNAYSSNSLALDAAVAWRDAKLADLPAAQNEKGKTRRQPLPHKRSWNRVGITRYFRGDLRKQGNPKYLTFGVNWVGSDGKKRTKSFQVGRLGEFTWQDEVRAANTAEAFRSEFEYCQAIGLSFDFKRYAKWKTEMCYPFRHGV